LRFLLAFLQIEETRFLAENGFRWSPCFWPTDCARLSGLTQRHTRAHMCEHWVPSLIDRRSYSEWLADSKRGAREWVQERARKLLAEHRPEPLEDGLHRELMRIIASAENRA